MQTCGVHYDTAQTGVLETAFRPWYSVFHPSDEATAAIVQRTPQVCMLPGVHASRGKITRAEPISALYEQKRCHHVGFFPVLEDQQCDYDPKLSKYSPDRMDALVWAFTELMTEEVAGEGWVAFMARQAAEAQLPAGWAPIPADIDPAAWSNRMWFAVTRSASRAGEGASPAGTVSSASAAIRSGGHMIRSPRSFLG
jgi:hypothetical protein